MKRLFILSFAAILFAGSAMAQNNQKATKDKAGKEWKKNKMHGKHKGPGFAKDLNLTDAQKEQIKALRQEQKSNAQKNRSEYKAKFDAILTAEQKAKLAEQRSQRQAAAKEKMQARSEKMNKELGITDAQGKQMKAINEEFRTKSKAIRENTSLSQDQKKEQFKALNEQRKASMKSVLTAEQIQKMEAKRKGMKNRKGHKVKK